MFHVSIESFVRFYKNFLPLLGLEMANSLPFLLNFIFLGEFGDPAIIAIYGLNNFLMNVVVFPVGFSLIEVAGVSFSKRFGERNYREIVNEFYRSLITLAVFISLYFLLCIFSQEIFVALNVEPVIAESSSRLIKWGTIFMPLIFINRFVQTFLSSQNIIRELLLINLFCIFFGIALSRICIFNLNMREFGIIPSRFAQEFISVVYSCYLFYKKADRETMGLPNWPEIWRGYPVFLRKFIFSALGTMTEWATFEINTFMAVQMQNIDKLAVFLAWTGISPIFYVIGFALSSTIRVIIGQLLGAGQKKKAREELTAYLFYIVVMCGVFGIFIIIFAKEIAGIYINNKDLSEPLSQTLYVLAVFLWGYVMFYPFFQVFRLLDLEKYFVIVLGTFFIAANTSFAAFLAFVLRWDVLGLVLGHGIATVCVELIFLRKIFYIHDWDIMELNFEENLLSRELSRKSSFETKRPSGPILTMSMNKKEEQAKN